VEGRRRAHRGPLPWALARVAAACLFALAVSRAAHAQESAPSSGPSVPAPPPGSPDAAPGRSTPPFGEEIIVRAPSRLETWPSRGDGITVKVIDSKELATTGARTLQEALQRLPGSALADEQGNSFQQDLSLRGFTASPVTGLGQGLSVFLDGVRVNEPGVEEVNFDLIPLPDVERIEVIRGANVILGRNTLGGAIHIITRRGGAKQEAEVEAEGGSWEYQQIHGRASGPLGPLDGYLSLTEFTERGWRAVGSSKGFRAFGKLGLLREDTDVTLSYQFQIDRLEEPGAIPASLLAVDPRQNYTAGDFFRPQLHLVTLNARQRLGHGLSLAVNGSFRALDAEQFNSSFASPDTRLFNQTRSGGSTVQLDHRASLGTLRSQLTVGAEVTRSEVHISVNEEPNAQVSETEDGLPLPHVTSDLTDEQLAVGAFLQEQLRVAEGPLAGLGATAALRFDRIRHDLVDVSPDDPGKANGNIAFSRWIPAVGLSYAFAPRWLTSISYAQGFRAPAFLELTCADPAAPCIGLQAGVAPDTSFKPLAPVRSQSYEAGVAGLPFQGLTVALNVFRIDLRDDIFSVSPAGTTSVIFQNVGDTRRQGLELTAHFERGIVEVQGGYAYTHATFESDISLFTPRLAPDPQAPADTPPPQETVRRGAQLPLIPNHRFDLECRVRVLSWLKLSAGLQYVGSQYLRGDEENVEPKLPGYLLARAGVEARWRTWTASIRATNPFDTRYETFGTFAPNGKAAVQPGESSPIERFLTPGLPLHVVAGVRWELD
jgi:iron complex outermembrane receptor protein